MKEWNNLFGGLFDDITAGLIPAGPSTAEPPPPPKPRFPSPPAGCVRLWWPSEAGGISGYDVERTYRQYGIRTRGRCLPGKNRTPDGWFGIDVGAGQARWAKYLLDRLGIEWHGSDGSRGRAAAPARRLPNSWNAPAPTDFLGRIMHALWGESAIVRRIPRR